MARYHLLYNLPKLVVIAKGIYNDRVKNRDNVDYKGLQEIYP